MAELHPGTDSEQGYTRGMTPGQAFGYPLRLQPGFVAMRWKPSQGSRPLFNR